MVNVLSHFYSLHCVATVLWSTVARKNLSVSFNTKMWVWVGDWVDRNVGAAEQSSLEFDASVQCTGVCPSPLPKKRGGYTSKCGNKYRILQSGSGCVIH